MLETKVVSSRYNRFENEIVADFILPFHRLEMPRLIQLIYYQFVSLSTFI